MHSCKFESYNVFNFVKFTMDFMDILKHISPGGRQKNAPFHREKSSF